MSYVELKHLLAALTLDAVRHPADAGWFAAAVACVELASADQPRILRRACLERAAALGAPFGWTPAEADLRRLIRTGLFEDENDLLVLPRRFLPHLAYFKRHAPRALKALAVLRAEDPAAPAPAEVRVGAALFNAGLFFECHEWFEGLWKAARGERKELYHGIVQAAAAFYHYEKANTHGCRTLLEKALRRLAPSPPVSIGMDLTRFTTDLRLWAAHLGGGPRPEDYPQLHLVAAAAPEEKAEGAPRG